MSMRRFVKLPPLKITPGSDDVKFDKIQSASHREGPQSPRTLSSASTINNKRGVDYAKKDSSTVLSVDNGHCISGYSGDLSSSPGIENDNTIFDCVLVYTETSAIEPQEDGKQTYVTQNIVEKVSGGSSYTPFWKEGIRRTFEEGLKNKYQLDIRTHIVEKITNKYPIRKLCRRKQISKKTYYILIRAPFHALLFSAENLRMKLPIKKIDYTKTPSAQTTNTSQPEYFDNRNSCVSCIKRVFGFLRPPTIDQRSYRTAVYSLSNIDQFSKFFNKPNPLETDSNCSSSGNLSDIDEEKYFTITQRQWLTYELLSRIPSDQLPMSKESPETRRYVGIQGLISKGIYDSCFPLHEKLDRDAPNDRLKLSEEWATLCKCFKHQPLRLIRLYMGEKVAFYFAAMRFYTTLLITPSIVGLIVFIYGAASVTSDKPTSDICGSFGHKTDMCPLCDKTCSFWKLSDSCSYAQISYVFDNIATVIFAIYMAIWARGFVEFWKRLQSELQYKWDSIDFNECNEPIRPEFQNQNLPKRYNPKTGRDEPYIARGVRCGRILWSVVVVLLLIIIVCLTIFSVVVYRIQMAYILKNTSVSSYSSILITVTSAVINLVCSLLLSPLYYWIARKLTDAELHKYQSKYEAAFSIKIYLFEFVNYYSSLFYIAFFKGRASDYPSTYGAQRTNDFTEQCDPAGCMVELSIQLLIIMAGKQIINTVSEYGLPLLRSINPFENTKKNKKQWEIDNRLKEFDWQTLLPEYLEMTIQFGFITLFVAAFPLAPLFALLNNLVELRLDAWKLLTKHRRPALYKAADIGIWTTILSSISYLAVLTNAAVIAWTSEFIPKLVYQITEGSGTSLDGYVNWTLSSFPISDYNATGTMNPNVPSNLTYCRYRDFRESIGPNYEYTSFHWHVVAARLAFMILFENVIFLIVYLFQLIVPDVPSQVQEGIDRERYTEQCHQSPAKDPSEVKEALQKIKIKTDSAENNQTNGDSINSNLLRNRRDQKANTRSIPIDASST